MESMGMTESSGTWAAISGVHGCNIAMAIRRINDPMGNVHANRYHEH